MVPGDYVYDLGGRRVLCVSRVMSVFAEGFDQEDHLCSAMRKNCITLDMKPAWWPFMGRTGRFIAMVPPLVISDDEPRST